VADAAPPGTRRVGAPYAALIVREAPRVLGLLDREPMSPTRGCMDRTFWAWKFTDFAGSRFQEGLCVLSLLYADELGGPTYHHNARLLDWIAGGFDFWCGLQRSGGDFDEAYPFERSLAATAFTSFYLAEAFHLVGEWLPEATAGRFRRSLARAADWLTVNDETHGFLSNHLAAAAGALANAHKICGDARYEGRSRYFLDRILSHQSDEGWYEEYGGADPGYQTHGSFYLARCLELSGDERLAASLDRSLTFMAHFVHPDGSLGGEYASRNTQTYYPAAFEMLSGRNGSASWIAETMRPSVESLAAAGLGSVDAYNYFPLLNNLVFAYRACVTSTVGKADETQPAQPNGLLHFPEAGIVKVRRDRYEAYVGLSKGGVLKVFDRRAKRLVCDDCGYLGRMKNGKLFTSQWFGQDWRTDVRDGEVVVEGRFVGIKKPVMRPTSFLLFRLFVLTVGRFRSVAYRLKRLLVSVLIYRRRDLDFAFQRRIVFDEDRVTIRDVLRSPLGDRIERLEQIDTFVTIHMGSSRYFVPHQLDVAAGVEAEARAPVDPAALAEGVTRERVVRLDGGF